MKKKIFVLDCTLRDGGFALEDAMINGDKTKVEYGSAVFTNAGEPAIGVISTTQYW